MDTRPGTETPTDGRPQCGWAWTPSRATATWCAWWSGPSAPAPPPSGVISDEPTWISPSRDATNATGVVERRVDFFPPEHPGAFLMNVSRLWRGGIVTPRLVAVG